jgi:hypothetical protein
MKDYPNILHNSKLILKEYYLVDEIYLLMDLSIEQIEV